MALPLDGKSIKVRTERADFIQRVIDKKKMQDEISTIEEQIQDLTRKAQLEKETQNKLHTCKDAIDAKGMEKEIQRMNKRLAGLVKTQEKLLNEIEGCLNRRFTK